MQTFVIPPIQLFLFIFIRYKTKNDRFLQHFESQQEKSFNRISEKNKEVYDLSNNVPTSQSVFEKRLASASANKKVEDDLQSMDSLDIFTSCNPDEYNYLWNNLSAGLVANSEFTSDFSIAELRHYFESRRFYIIASGLSDDKIVIFLLAQRKGIRCLVKISIDMKKYNILQKLKSENPKLNHSFLKSLNLQNFIVSSQDFNNET